jgi:hypothetical protein
MQALKKIDWELLGKQKLTLVEVLDSRKLNDYQREAMEGILNLLDEMTDENYHNNN